MTVVCQSRLSLFQDSNRVLCLLDMHLFFLCYLFFFLVLSWWHWLIRVLCEKLMKAYIFHDDESFVHSHVMPVFCYYLYFAKKKNRADWKSSRFHCIHLLEEAICIRFFLMLWWRSRIETDQPAEKLYSYKKWSRLCARLDYLCNKIKIRWCQFWFDTIINRSVNSKILSLMYFSLFSIRCQYDLVEQTHFNPKIVFILVYLN